MKKINVEYRTDIITENGYVKPDGFSSIEFQNPGSDDAVILEHIPLAAGGDPVVFINRPGEIIKNNFPVKFSTATAPMVVIIKTYYMIQDEQQV